MKYRFEQTCPACPEQYDVWDGDTKVAYVRYRWGGLRVNPYHQEKHETTDYNGDKCMEQAIDFDTIICSASIGDDLDGMLPLSERDSILEKVDKAIQEYYLNKDS